MSMSGLASDFSGMSGPASGGNGIIYLRPTTMQTDAPGAPSMVSAALTGQGVEVKVAAGALLVMGSVLLALHMWTRGHQL